MKWGWTRRKESPNITELDTFTVLLGRAELRAIACRLNGTRWWTNLFVLVTGVSSPKKYCWSIKEQWNVEIALQMSMLEKMKEQNGKTLGTYWFFYLYHKLTSSFAASKLRRLIFIGFPIRCKNQRLRGSITLCLCLWINHLIVLSRTTFLTSK